MREISHDEVFYVMNKYVKSQRTVERLEPTGKHQVIKLFMDLNICFLRSVDGLHKAKFWLWTGGLSSLRKNLFRQIC